MRLPTLSLLFAGAAQLGALCAAAQNSSWPVRSSGYTDLVQWDHYSLIVNGTRVFLWSGEFHYWRIPVPAVWRDLLQKIKAGGFNAFSVYGHWAFHAPNPDTLDFESGARNFTTILDIAKEVGLYVVWRPGPYVNAESTAGGFALWTTTGAYGTLRNNDTRYTDAWTPYMTAYNKLLAPHQITNGGNLIMVQIENEFSGQQFSNGTENWDAIAYMEKLEKNARDNGLKIPLFTNSPSDTSYSWSQDYDKHGAQDIYGFDSYPECWSTNIGECGSVEPFTVQDYHDHFDVVSPNQPSFLPEFQGGAYTPWGGARNGVSNLGSAFANVFYRHNIAERVTMMSLYMVFGGTNWGGLATDLVGSDYNYSAPISADRTLSTKYYETKLLGLFIDAAPDLRMTDRRAYGTNYTVLHGTTAANASLGPVGATELRNPVTGAAFYVVRHNVSASEDTSTFALKVDTSAGAMEVPRRGGAITLAGRESKIVVTDFAFGEHTLVYSTAEVLSWTVADGQPILALWLPTGESGEFTLKGKALLQKTFSGSSSKAPSVTTDAIGNTVVSYTQAGDAPSVLQFSNFKVLLHSRTSAYRFWAPSTTSAPLPAPGSGARLFVTGPYLVRSAAYAGKHALALTGDVDAADATLEVFAPAAVTALTWNGKMLRGTHRTAYGSLVAPLPGPSMSVQALQSSLNFSHWRYADALPERSPTYDDSRWTVVNKSAASSPNPLVRPGTDVSLFADEYGYHTGALLWRARFVAGKNVAGAWVNVQGGTAFGFSVWLNGGFIGSCFGDVDSAAYNTTLPFANATLHADNKTENVLVILQDHMGHDQRAEALQPRGILGFALAGGESAGAEVSKWTLAGNAGGEANIDPVRGNIAEGGFHAERLGWHLPGFDDSHWATGTPEQGLSEAGVRFYRSNLRLDVPAGHDAALGFSLSAPAGSTVRAQLYVNGYQYGKFVPHIGAQTLFPVPPGILNYRGDNDVGVLVWAQGAHGGAVTLAPVVTGLVASAWNPAFDASALQPRWTPARLKYA